MPLGRVFNEKGDAIIDKHEGVEDMTHSDVAVPRSRNICVAFSIHRWMSCMKLYLPVS